ncbi:preprotein translocase subunit YajC [Corynebacterium choanae]|uniref:Preprotein translocase subunit YajC n=1 Tax=Corynebacterium choanae TaxID=1862358 RepID=A0A3G6J750_9CORY|nr:preprotein translocase subunit YajC [Corynebacterium choanae]AZA13699.1 preprotein translocase subunit YajC [Corynebacterium choanae]
MSNSTSSPLLLLLLVAIVLIPLFLQKRRTDKVKASLQALQAALTPGLPVVTTAGIHGVVESVDEVARTVELRIAPAVVCTLDLAAIIRVQGSRELGAAGLDKQSTD